ncbi:MAG: HNH endonuclease signature motif containing protein [Candidatus Aenigmarchaeota archaeon]|nr:HNH endonuclease signature motif containing protein [Candidatus Aenigmarchaeota archaeon]
MEEEFDFNHWEEDGEAGIKGEKPISSDNRWKVLQKQHFKCKRCGADLRKVVPHIHHKTLLPQSGSKNVKLVALCPNCHSIAREHENKKITNYSEEDEREFEW